MTLRILFFLFFGALVCSSTIAQLSVFDIARKGTLSEMQELYSKFPDTINTTNDAGYTALILACYYGNNDVAVFLAENCRNINGNSDYGTPLMAAVVKRNETMVAKLLELKADPNIADPNKTTALHYAVMFQIESIIKLLMKWKADPTLKDQRGFSSLDYANKTKSQKIINLLTTKS